MARVFRYLILLLVLASAPATLHAQEAGEGDGKSAGMTKKQQEKHLAKKERADKKSVAKEEKRLKKIHLEHQDKATQKRMKRNKRNADRHGQAGQRDPFLKRLFGSKH